MPFCLSKNTIDPMRVQISTILHAKKQYSYNLAFLWMATQAHKPVSFHIPVHIGEYGEKHKLKMLRERCRLAAVEDGVDAMFFLDCDTIPPVDAIDQLLEVPGEVVTGIYYSRLGGATDRAVCWKTTDPAQAFVNSEHISEIDGAGMGCCLIRKSVLECCTFDQSVPDDDYPFWVQAKKEGFRLRSLNTLRCRHYQTETDFIQHEFGFVGKEELESYQVVSPEGVTINGSLYKGSVSAGAKIMETIRDLDRPYREGILKVESRDLKFVGKKQASMKKLLTLKDDPQKYGAKRVEQLVAAGMKPPAGMKPFAVKRNAILTKKW